MRRPRYRIELAPELQYLIGQTSALSAVLLGISLLSEGLAWQEMKIKSCDDGLVPEKVGIEVDGTDGTMWSTMVDHSTQYTHNVDRVAALNGVSAETVFPSEREVMVPDQLCALSEEGLGSFVVGETPQVTSGVDDRTFVAQLDMVHARKAHARLSEVADETQSETSEANLETDSDMRIIGQAVAVGLALFGALRLMAGKRWRKRQMVGV